MLRLAEDHSKDSHDPHKIYEFVSSGVLEVRLPLEGWDFECPQGRHYTPHFSPQESGTYLSQISLKTTMADTVPLILR